jgi:GT2 family glycosyltransferase
MEYDYQIDLIKKSNLFDSEYYRSHYDFNENIDPVFHFITEGWRLGYNPNPEFDTKKYIEMNQDVLTININPLLHYVSVMKNNSPGSEDRVIEKQKIKKELEIIVKSNLFDRDFYTSNYRSYLEATRLSPEEHFVIIGAKLGLNPNSEFNIEEYIKNNPTLSNLHINPFVHYLAQGAQKSKATKDIKYSSDELYQNMYLIHKSKLFDEAFYLATYDKYLQNLDVSPLEHYLTNGWLQGFNPSKSFITNDYLKLYPDVKKSGENPLVHHLRYGQNEGRFTNIQSYHNRNYYKNQIAEKDQFLSLAESFNLFRNNRNQSTDHIKKIVPLILPVYGNLPLLKKCVNSIFSNTRIPFKLIIIDDANEDHEIIEYLNSLLNTKENVLLLRNQANSGFIKSVNSALPYIDYHFALVNSDIEVPDGWLERLLYPICTNSNIASTTPFTNAGTICSFPVTLKDNSLFESMPLSIIDKAFQIIDQRNYIEIPTAVGFCMGVNKEIVDRIGFFDEERFHRGYGEENDWCMRALNEGYSNVIVQNLFVYHKHGGSFSEDEKNMLLNSNLKALGKIHPQYNDTVGEYIARDPLAITRNIITALLISQLDSDLVLHIDHSLGGGANLYSEEIIQNNLKNDKPVLLFTYDIDGVLYLTLLYRDYTCKFKTSDYNQILNFLRIINIKEIFFNNIYLYQTPFDIIDTVVFLKKERPNIYITFPVHDYYSICPSLNLLNSEKKYCGASTDIPTCSACLSSLKPSLSKGVPSSLPSTFFEIGIEKWRSKWKTLLSISDSILCFSENSKSIFTKVYPHLSEKINLIPHKVQYLPKNTSSKSIYIGIIGNINFSKGRQIIHEMISIIEYNNLNVHFVLFGSIDQKPSSKHFHYQGRYKRENLAQIISLYKIDVFFISSVWPETFSYTTEELITLDQKVACFDIGAPAERIKNYDHGILIPKIEALTALKYLIESAN